MFRQMRAENVRVPNGFALTVRAYYSALQSCDAWTRLQALMAGLDVRDVAALSERGSAARKIVYEATGGPELRKEIIEAYRGLEVEYGVGGAVAVRSSATAEDLPTASFAGQHESYLNISGADDLVEACRLCLASLFTDRAIVYRVNNGFDHFKVGLSVGVMKMVAIGGAKRNGRKVCICGEAPASYPEIARFLTGLGIDSISVNPASVLRTIQIVREAEAAN